jgi:ABC-2 type transport system ATP-binding protein
MAKRKLPVVQTAGLCKTFRDFWRRPRVEAVKDLNLEIHPGEVFGLLGPNGSGKSTTIKMLLGLLYPTRGRIALFGRAPTDVAVKSRIGYLPEESYLYRFLGARETLDHFGRLFRLPGHVRKERTERLLEMVGLKHEAERPIGEYSKGMARRIGLAQALVNDPEFLILDEPTSGLDPIGARQIKDVIRELGRKGKTVLLSSHMLADVEDVCDRVSVLYGGQTRITGSVDELLAERERTQLTVGSLSEDTVNEVRRIIRERDGAEVYSVDHPRVRLESVFLRIVEEAQVANIRTSGAVAGGALPDFLSKATVQTTDAVVESLMAAAPREEEAQPTASPAPVPASVQASRVREEAEAQQVLDGLLGKAPVEDEAAEEDDLPAPAPMSPEPMRTVEAVDHGVIDDLLSGRSDDGETDSSKPDAGGK